MKPEQANGWKISTQEISLSTQGQDQILDVTAEVRDTVDKSGVSEGQALIFIPGATASVTTLEFEPGMQKDLPAVLNEIMPFQRDWAHHQTWGDDNGGSHVRAALIGPSLTVPIVQGQLTLGTWQQVVVIDHDTRGRNRRVVIQVMGR